MTQYLKLYGERLVELGYTVLPIKPGSKRPDIKDWPRHATTGADVVKWYSNGRAQHGVGINARNTPAIDVDVLDPEVAQAMSDAIDQIFPGVSLMTRTGLAPKFLIPFRSDEPFRKLVSQTYTDGKNDHKVEILGDGQQWVAFHIHPETGKPYLWFDGVGDRGIVGVQQSALPRLDVGDAQRVIDAFEHLASAKCAAGLWRAKDVGERADVRERSGDDPFVDRAPVGKEAHEVEALLVQLPNESKDYDHWFKVLAAVHHELGDEGREHAYEWSIKCADHADARFDTTWNSLGSYTGRQITLRSLLKGKSKETVPLKSQPIMSAADFAGTGSIEWHVKHVIPKRGLIVVYGAPGSSKSFFVFDLIAHVVRGLPWRSHRTKQANVLYAVAEGAEGFKTRVKAYHEHHKLTLDGLFIRPGSLLLAEQTVDLCAQIEAIGGVGIVVIDTLAAVTPGANENTSEDMGRAIANANFITETTGASVILIHHANRQGELRGWSGLLAAADNTIRVEYDREKDLRTVHIEKQKEAKSDGEYGYRLRVVDLGLDVDGDPVTSCVVEECTDTTPNTSGKNVKRERKSRSGDFETSENYGKARHYLQAIQSAMGLETDASMSEDEVIEAIQADPLVNQMQEKDYPPKRYILPTLRTLAEKGKIVKEGRRIRLCS